MWIVEVFDNTDACGLNADLLDANDLDLFLEKNNLITLLREIASIEISSSCSNIS